MPEGGWIVGKRVRLRALFTIDGMPEDPSEVTVIIRRPDATEDETYVAPALTTPDDETDVRELLIDLDVAGWWRWRVEAEGDVTTADEGRFYVRPSTFPTP
jgi:hypothetical protein